MVSVLYFFGFLVGLHIAHGLDFINQNKRACSITPVLNKKCSHPRKMFYYDQSVGDCLSQKVCPPTTFGNAFDTEENCEKLCRIPGNEKDATQEEDSNNENASEEIAAAALRTTFRHSCSKPKDPGFCGMNLHRYWYSRNVGTCLPFTYGGCGGNENNYPSYKDCLQICVSPGASRPEGNYGNICRLPKNYGGKCFGHIPRYWFNQLTGGCEKFHYKGCNGNYNNFKTEDECLNRCNLGMGAPFNPLRPYVPDKCGLPLDIGHHCGSSYFAFISNRYWYNPVTGVCQMFVYKGCGGNINNFLSAKKCQKQCKR